MLYRSHRPELFDESREADGLASHVQASRPSCCESQFG